MKLETHSFRHRNLDPSSCCYLTRNCKVSIANTFTDDLVKFPQLPPHSLLSSLRWPLTLFGWLGLKDSTKAAITFPCLQTGSTSHIYAYEFHDLPIAPTPEEAAEQVPRYSCPTASLLNGSPKWSFFSHQMK